jgi:putative transposase
MKKESTPSFVAEFELESSSKGFSILDKTLNAYRQIYNSTLGELKKNLTAARASDEWQQARQLPAGSKERIDAFREVRKKYQLSSQQAQQIAASHRQGHLEELTNSRVLQQIAKRAWRAVERVMFGKSKRVRFRKRNEFLSFEGNDQKTGIVVQKSTGTVRVASRDFIYKVDNTNPYHLHALSCRVKYARIIKRRIGGNSRFFVQMVLEGKPYQNPKHTTISGQHIGLDLGPSKVAVSTKTESFQQEFCEGLDKKESEIRKLQRALERSRRKNNPGNYDECGKIKPGPKKWKTTKHYLALREQLKELQRKKAAHRKSLQGNLANRILKLGNQIHTEKVSYRAWQKVYGKSVGNQAPSAFESIVTRKAETLGGGVEKINTYQTALSQHCICGDKQKKSLGERMHNCSKCGFRAPRDELSAYLALHTTFTDGEWRTDFKEAFSGILRHRTLSLGQELKPEPGAVCEGDVSSGESATEGSQILKRKSRCVRALRTEDWKPT